MKPQRSLVAAIVNVVVVIASLCMFALACWTERPYAVAFFGVLLILDAIHEAGR